MERKWLWKKKSSDKVAAAPEAFDVQSEENVCVTEAMAFQEGLQLEETVKLLNDKLAAAQSEIIEKDAVVKQHMKVAEEAVTGWEKSESEAAILKSELEESKQKKNALEDRVLQLDNALKECVRQLRLVREEQEQKIQQTVATKTREWEEERFRLETELNEARTQLAQSGAHSSAVSKSLQERTLAILELNDAKAQAEIESRNAHARLESVEKEYTALKYDLQVLQRELQIRNEEREYSQKTVEAANRQQIENVKKINKLEAECQRLKMLLKKKLPGPGAVAQMRVEVDPYTKDSPKKLYPTRSGKSIDSMDDKENESYTDKIREMTMLRETLAKKNEELHESRLMCAKTASKLSHVEEQLESLSHIKISQGVTTPTTDKFTNFELMDDFIEMERLSKETTKQEAEEAQNAKQVCDKFAVAEKKHMNQVPDGLFMRNGKLDTIDAESKARLRSAVGRIIHLVESMVQEYSSDSSSEMETGTQDRGVKRLVDVSKNLLQGKVPVLDFIAELSCVLDFVVGLSLHSGSLLGRSDSSKSSERSSGSSEYMREVSDLKAEITNLESCLKSSTETVETMKLQLASMEEERTTLHEQLVTAQEERKAAASELSSLKLVKDKVEASLDAAEDELQKLRKDTVCLRTELQEEQRRHRDALHKLQMPRQEESITQQKEQELVAAAEKLAECQQTILALGKQLESFGLPPTPSRHFAPHNEYRDHVHKQETYWSSGPIMSDSDYHSGVYGRNVNRDVCLYNCGRPEEAVDAFEVTTPARYHHNRRKTKASRGYAHTGDLSRSADLNCDKQGGGGVLGLGKFFSRGKGGH